MPESTPTPPPVLAVEALQVRLGAPRSAHDDRAGHILHDIDLQIAPGERVALLGRNGAGKTTLLRALLGLVPAQAKRMALNGQDVAQWPTDQRARGGLAYVPQGRQLYARFTVEQNLLLATLHTGLATRTPRNGDGRWLARLRSGWRRSPPSLEQAYSTFPALYARRADPAGILSGGQQQQLAVARALLTRPRLILLDEPLEGVQPSVVTELAQALETLNQKEGVALLWVDQNLDVVLQRCTRVLFMERGRLVAGTTAAVLRADATLIERYLGA